MKTRELVGEEPSLGEEPGTSRREMPGTSSSHVEFPAFSGRAFEGHSKLGADAEIRSDGLLALRGPQASLEFEGVKRLLTIASRIDRLTSAIGRGVSWLALAMILIGAYNALARYLGRFVEWRLSSNLYLELQWYLFSVLFLLAAAWALKEDAHVRVDVIYGRLSQRACAWIDLFGGLLMLLPFCLFTVVVSVPSVRSSWAIREGSPDPGGLPRYPLKTIVLLALVLLALQGLAETIRSVARLESEEPPSPSERRSLEEG